MLSDDEIIERGGTQEDIDSYAHDVGGACGGQHCDYPGCKDAQMKPSKDLDEQIEEILAVFANYDDSYEPGYEEGVLSHIDRTKQQLLALIEQIEREARIDELTNFMSTMVTTHGDTPARSVSTAKIRERIEALKAGK